MKKKLGASLFAAAAVGAMLVAPPVNAVTEHCPAGGMKYNVDAGPTVYVGKQYAYKTVCIKVGTRIDEDVVVDKDGYITNTTLLNKNDKRMGISYYVIYDGDTPPPPVS